MGPRFQTVDRNTPMLLPPDLREWVREDDLVHFVIEAVERLSIHKFHLNLKGCGDAQFPPHMMLALLVYCYANGIFSSRRIERATYRDVAVRYLTADTHPDHDTICRFRRQNLQAIAEAFIDVLELARELGMVKLGTVSVDGTHIKANASKDKNVTYERACELREQLRLDIDHLLQEAEQADAKDQDNQKLPDEIARREKLLAKMDLACERLEERARQRARKEQAEYEKKLAARDERPPCKKGPEPKSPSDTPRADEQINLTDAESNLMRKNKREGYTQSYNAQGIEPLVSVYREDAHSERRYEFRPPQKKKPSKNITDPRLLAMREKLQTEEGKKRYKLRAQTVEPVFGIIKQVLGFRQFLLRGAEKVSGEWSLICLAYNLKRMHILRMMN